MRLLFNSFDRHALELLERMLTLDPSQVNILIVDDKVLDFIAFTIPFLHAKEKKTVQQSVPI